ncbi:unnamed protein product [Linum trigynum]|uniref:Uncharacterized protein n=1 Tax=Linum trigynum TaxID=586398 RepID=A0AAV2GR01_9ROSI
MRSTWCHEVVAISRAGIRQVVEGEIKTSSWFMEAKGRTSTPSSHDRETRLNTNPTRHRGHQVPTSAKTEQGPQGDGYQLVTKAGQGTPRRFGARGQLAVTMAFTKAFTPGGYK